MGPLGGIRVVEVASLAPGPFGAMILSDLGADVLRIDRVDQCGPDAVAPTDPLARGRRSIGLNLKEPEGTALLLRRIWAIPAAVSGWLILTGLVATWLHAKPPAEESSRFWELSGDST